MLARTLVTKTSRATSLGIVNTGSTNRASSDMKQSPHCHTYLIPNVRHEDEVMQQTISKVLMIGEVVAPFLHLY